MDRPDSTGREQFTSGTLEACHPLWPCCWSDASPLAGYATLMMNDDLNDLMLHILLEDKDILF